MTDLATSAVASVLTGTPLLAAAPGEAAVFVIFPMIMIISVVGIVFKFVTSHRKMLHEERLKAIEKGITLDPSPQMNEREKIRHNAFWISFWVGGMTPCGVIGLSIAIMEEYRVRDFEFIVLWGGTISVCIVALCSAAAIMMSTHRHDPQALDDTQVGVARPTRDYTEVRS